MTRLSKSFLSKSFEWPPAVGKLTRVQENPMILCLLQVLSQILKFLTYADIQNIRLTCHTFYVASLDCRTLDRETVIFDEEYYCFQPASLLLSNRNFLHLRLQNYKSFSVDSTVWSHIGPPLRSLSLVSCKLSERHLFAVLSHCTNLRYLEISTCLIQSRPKYKDVFQNLTSPFKKLFNSETDAKRLSSYKKTKLGFVDTAQFTKLEDFRIDDPTDSRLLDKILKNAPNLKSHSVTIIQKQSAKHQTVYFKLGQKSFKISRT